MTRRTRHRRTRPRRSTGSGVSPPSRTQTNPGEDVIERTLAMPVGSQWYPKEGRIQMIEVTEEYVRLRLRNPGLYEEWGTHDVGRKGHTKRVAGKRKDTGEWETQAWLFRREDLAKEPETRQLFRETLEAGSRGEPPNNPDTARVVEEVDGILNEPRYEDFVERLGAAARDPKLRGVLVGGLLDGKLLDDLVQHDVGMLRMGRNLKPIQHEIDLEKSLEWVGRHPENVPLMLRGGTLGPEHLGGNPMVISYGRYIIDGHHRWSQVYMINPEARLKCINLHVEDPGAALRKSQTAIAALTGEVPVARVEPGKNVYTMKPGEIRAAIPRYLGPEFYQAFYDTHPDSFQTREDVHGYIYGNIMRMRRSSQPHTDIGRELMPQYTKVGAKEGAEALKAGVVNVKPPYMLKKRPEDE